MSHDLNPAADRSPEQLARVRAAFDAVDRRGFLPEARRGDAAYDVPLPIGHGQTNSQPTTVSNMLVLLDVPSGATVLDVGAGSGWTTALLAHLAGPEGRVLGLEVVPELREAGAANLALATAATPRADRFAPAEIRLAGRDRLGAPDEGPFDRILVSAEPDELPPSLVAQLAPGGVMVIPVAGVMLRVHREDAGTVRTTRHGYYRFVPLV